MSAAGPQGISCASCATGELLVPVSSKAESAMHARTALASDSSEDSPSAARMITDLHLVMEHFLMSLMVAALPVRVTI